MTFLDNAVQNGSGTVNLRATVAECRPPFLAGPVCQCRLVLQPKKAAVLIPNEATQISQKGPFVYVVKPDDTAELRPVTLGQRQGDNVVVTTGVAARRARGGDRSHAYSRSRCEGAGCSGAAVRPVQEQILGDEASQPEGGRESL